ncbi:unnamed protein product [Plutella xylostella]|uniref:(diamondback moth) hypothetical protein n=1 Tax=Plutella xylostella TaxID=51655 RepID=A0A8S4D190_PLUXY|nr:unnamed protein product [Plutella xylostella]
MITISLKLIEAFSNETNFTVWSSISNCLGKLSGLFSHTALDKPLKNYGRKLFANITERLGWDAQEKESHLDTLLRSLVLNKMISFEDPETIREAKARFEKHLSGECPLAADLRSAVYRAVLGDADAATFQRFLQLYRAADLHEEKDRVSRALGAVKDPALLTKVLEFAISVSMPPHSACRPAVLGDADSATFQRFLQLYRAADLHEEKDRVSRALGAVKDPALLTKVLEFAISDEVRSQDTVFVIVSVALSRDGRDLAWQFFKEHWQEFMDRYQGGFLLARLVKSTTENFASEAAAQEIEQFFAAHHSPGTERSVQQALETVRLNAAWLRRDLASTTAYLQAYH